VYWIFEFFQSDIENTSYGCRNIRPFFHYGTYSSSTIIISLQKQGFASSRNAHEK
jgi:hypothetical protein